MGLALAPGAQALVTISGTTYYEFKTQNCSNQSVCAVGFTAVPDGKTVTIRDMSCTWINSTANSTAVRATFSIIAGNATVALDGYPMAPAEIAAKTMNIAVHNGGFGATVPAGMSVRATVAFTASLPSNIMSCTISGTIQP